jgi:hypothetical protein
VRVNAVTLGSVLVLLTSLAPPARADVFLLRDGTSVEGQELRDLGDRLELRTRDGQRTIDKGEIRRRESKATPWEIFEKELTLADAENADELFDLGYRARRDGLAAEARRAFRMALAADPEHSRSRLAMGHIKVDGRWVGPAGEKPPAEETGEAIPAAELTPRESTLGLAMAKRRSANFQVESPYLDQKALGRFLDTFESVRETMLEFSGEPPPVGRGSSFVVLLSRVEEYERALELLVRPALPSTLTAREIQARMVLYRKSRVAPVQKARDALCVCAPAGSGEIENRAYLAHFIAHDVFRSITSPGVEVPAWISEAVVYRIVNAAFPDDPVHCVAADGYARTGGPSEVWRNTRTWPARARDLVVQERSVDIASLTAMDLNSLSFDALVQAWSVLDFLHRRDDSGTRGLLRRVRRGIPFPEALKESLDLDAPALDRLWRQDVLKRK